MESSAATADAALGSNSEPAGPEQPGAYAIFKRTTIRNIHRAYGGEDAFLATGFAKILELEGGDVERARKTLDEIIHTNWEEAGPEMRNLFEDAASRYRGSRSEVEPQANTDPSTPPVPHHDQVNRDDSDTEDEMSIGLWLARVKSNRISSGKKQRVPRREAGTHKSASAAAVVQENNQGPAQAQTDTRKTKLRRIGDSSSDNGGAKKGNSRKEATRSVVPELTTYQANLGRPASAGRGAQGTMRAASLHASATGRSDATKVTDTVVGDSGGASSPENATAGMTAMRRRGSGHEGDEATKRGRCRGAGPADFRGTVGTASRSGSLPMATGYGGKRSRSNGGASSPTNIPEKRRAPKSARRSAPPPATTTRSAGLGGGSIVPAQSNAVTSGGATLMAVADLTAAPEHIGLTSVSPGVVTRRRAASTGGTQISGMIGHPGVRKMLTEKELKTSRVRRKSQAESGGDPATSAPEELLPAPITDTTLQVRRNLCGGDVRRCGGDVTRSTHSGSLPSTPALDSRTTLPAEAAAAAPMSQERVSRKVEPAASMGEGKTMEALVVLHAPKDEMEAEAEGYVSSANEANSGLTPEEKKLNAAVGLADLAEGSPSLTKESRRVAEEPQSSQMKGTQGSVKTSKKKNSETKDKAPLDETESSSTVKANTEHGRTGAGRGGRALVVPTSWTAVSVTAADEYTQKHDARGRGKGRAVEAVGREALSYSSSSPGGRSKAQGKSPIGKGRREEGRAAALARGKRGPSSGKEKGAQAKEPCDASEKTADGGSAAATTLQSAIRAAYAKARSARRRLVRRAARMRGNTADDNGATARLRKVAIKGARRIPRAASPKGTERKGINRASSEPGAAAEGSDGARNGGEFDAAGGRNVFGIPCEKKAAIEVLWEVEDQTSRRLGEETKMDWFNAFVDLTTIRGMDEDGRPEWNIAYPVRRSPLNKYQPIKGLKSYVVFLSKDNLRDAENDEPLRWRKKVATHENNTGR